LITSFSIWTILDLNLDKSSLRWYSPT